MNGQQVLGLVKEGSFLRIPGLAVARLTTNQPQAASPPETGEIDLAQYEGKLLRVAGLDQGDWVYDARVLDVHSTAGAAPSVALVRAMARLPVGSLALPGTLHVPAAQMAAVPGGAGKFTEGVSLETLLERQLPDGTRVHRISYPAGGHSHWHWHDGEQALYALKGKGWLEAAGEGRITLSQGDLAYITPGTRHWHGATPDEEFLHLAFTASGGAEWEEAVTPEEYGRNAG